MSGIYSKFNEAVRKEVAWLKVRARVLEIERDALAAAERALADTPRPVRRGGKVLVVVVRPRRR